MKIRGYQRPQKPLQKKKKKKKTFLKITLRLVFFQDFLSRHVCSLSLSCYQSLSYEQTRWRRQNLGKTIPPFIHPFSFLFPSPFLPIPPHFLLRIPSTLSHLLFPILFQLFSFLPTIVFLKSLNQETCFLSFLIISLTSCLENQPKHRETRPEKQNQIKGGGGG